MNRRRFLSALGALFVPLLPARSLRAEFVLMESGFGGVPLPGVYVRYIGWHPVDWREYSIDKKMGVAVRGGKLWAIWFGGPQAGMTIEQQADMVERVMRDPANVLEWQRLMAYYREHVE